MSEDEREFREFIRHVRFDDEPDPRHRDRLEQRLVGTVERRSRTRPAGMGAIRPLRKGARIMNRNCVKYPAAAAAVLAVAIVVLINLTARKAYAMSDVPQLLRGAKTLHARFWTNNAPPIPGKGEAKQRVRVTMEAWFDLSKGRYRKTWASVEAKDGAVIVRPKESVCDGRVVMSVDHAGKSVSYERLTPFQARFHTRGGVEHMLLKMRRIFGPGQGEFQKKVGRQKVKGEWFDVYAGEVTAGGAGIKFRTWFSPATGDVGKLIVWVKAAAGEWTADFGIDVVERDVPLPSGAFDAAAPPGYALRNTPETAPARAFNPSTRRSDKLELGTYPSYVMPDGSVIVGWHSIDKAAGPPEAERFRSLTPGGALPELPVVVRGLEAVTTGKLLDYMGALAPPAPPAEKRVRYAGRHLAVTTKGGRHCEWALYVPLSAPPPRDSISAYKCLLGFTPRDRKVPGALAAVLDILTPIGAHDFDPFVRGQMAQLSDTGAPKHVTYEAVARLSKTIRDTWSDR